MKINKLGKAILNLMLGSVIAFAGCAKIAEGDDGSQKQLGVRPVKLNMNGVKGFVVLGNEPVAKAYTRSVDKEVGDTIQESVNIPAPYSLYSIDENNEITLSVFYFEVTTNDEGLQEVFENELKGAIQLVPSLITDLGKYILFSGCRFYVCKAGLSQELQQICDTIIENLHRRYYLYADEFLLRKSDGALFDITEQRLFRYYSIYINEVIGVEFQEREDLTEQSSLESIVEDTYFTHNDNIYVIIKYAHPDRNGVYKIEDNGNAIDISKVTQNGYFTNAVVDKDDNVYALTEGGPSCKLHIYRAGGGFDIDSRYDSCISMDTDNQGNAYLFTKDYVSGKGFVEISLADGKAQESFYTGESMWKSYRWDDIYLLNHLGAPTSPIDDDFDSFTFPLGYKNNAFVWLFGYRDRNDDSSYTYHPYLFEYRPVGSDSVIDFWGVVKTAFEAKYDLMSLGEICCGVRVNGSNVEVTQIDIFNKTVTTNTFEIDAISSLVGHKYRVANFANPTLYIAGRSKIDGAYAMISVDLLTGDNSASFAGDAREVVTLLRIN